MSSQHAFTAVCNLSFRPKEGLTCLSIFPPTLIAGLIKDIASSHKPWLSSLCACFFGEASKKTISSSLELPCESEL